MAELVAESLHYLDGRQIDLDSYTILVNHVHVLFKPLFDDQADTYFSISSIMHAHKRFTARQANALLGRQGQFWQHESYDHFARDAAEIDRIRRTILLNPVSAGLVEDWQAWPWTYSKMLPAPQQLQREPDIASGR